MEIDKLYYKCPHIDMLQYQYRFWQYIVLMNQSYLGDFFSHIMALAGASVSHWHISSFQLQMKVCAQRPG